MRTMIRIGTAWMLAIFLAVTIGAVSLVQAQIGYQSSGYYAEEKKADEPEKPKTQPNEEEEGGCKC